MSVEPGWYPDPFDPTQDRWWNGQAWTENTQVGPQSPDPYAEARAEDAPADGDYVSTLEESGPDLPDYEVLASVEEGALHATAPSDQFDDGSSIPAPRKRGLGKIFGVLGLVVALLAVSGVAAAYFLLGGRGPQPEDILPSDTAFLVRVDFDPSLDQKAKVAQLLASLPESTISGGGSGGTDPKAAVVKSLFPDDPGAASDALAWLGPRIGLGGLANGGEVTPIVVASVTDEPALDTFMSRHAPELFYAVHDGYAIISTAESVVGKVTGAEQHLADNAAFSSDLEALGVSPLAIAWADLAAAAAAAEVLEGSSVPMLPVDIDSAEASGSTMLGVSAESNSLRFVAVTNGVTLPDAPSVDLAVTGDGMSSLPASSLAAVSFANLSGIAAELIEDFGGVDSPEVQSLESGLGEIGVTLDEVVAALGEQTSVIVLSRNGSSVEDSFPALVIRGAEGQNEAVQKTLQALLEASGATALGDGGVAVIEDNGLLFICAKADEDQLTEVLAAGQRLGDSSDFSTLFPNGTNAFVTAYVSAEAINAISEMSDTQQPSVVLGAGLTVTVKEGSPGNSRTELTLLLTE